MPPERLLVPGILVCAFAAALIASQGLHEPVQPAGSTIAGSGKPVRAFHFVLRKVSTERAEWLLTRMQQAGFNTVQVVITDGVRLDSAPWRPLPDAWSTEELQAFAASARSKGIAIVPELKLLTHQERFLQSGFPRLMFNKATYDPRAPEIYDLVFAVIDEIVALLAPASIHIGHDEVAGHNAGSREKWLREGEEVLPAALFIEDVRRLKDYLDRRGIRTMLWADMLLSPAEFPTMRPGHLHGTPPGYGAALREQLPRDVVLCDWHYFDRQAEFPSTRVLVDEGFEVIGTVWKRDSTTAAFSAYAAQHGASGMMATSWAHVQRGEWQVVERIIERAGAAFERDFCEAPCDRDIPR